MNQPHDVAKIIVQCSADQSLNGTAIFVSGGKFFDTEEGVDRTLPQWLGEKNAQEFLKGQEVLGLVSGLKSPHDEVGIAGTDKLTGR